MRHERVMRLACEGCSACVSGSSNIEEKVSTSPRECLQTCIQDYSCVAVDVGTFALAGKCTIIRSSGGASDCFDQGVTYDSYAKVPGRMGRVTTVPIAVEPCLGDVADSQVLMDGNVDTVFGEDDTGCARHFNNWWLLFDAHNIFQLITQVDVAFNDNNVAVFEVGKCGTNEISSCTKIATCKVKHWPYATMNLCSFDPTSSRYWSIRIPETHTGWKPLVTEISFALFHPSLPIPATRVATGSGHSCALLGGRVKCWGLNDKRQADPSSPSGAIVKGQSYVGTIGLVTHVAVSDAATCAIAIMPAGTVLNCWGSNLHGELGATLAAGVLFTVRESSERPLDIAGGKHHFCSIHGSDRRLICWGKGDNGQLGNEDLLSRPVDAEPTWVMRHGSVLVGVQQVGCGDAFTCALVESEEVFCWGANADGQLALGGFSEAVKSPLLAISGAKALGVGSSHACALRGDGYVACWGNNFNGQLGLSDRITRASPHVLPAISGVIGLSVGGSASCAFVDSVLTPHCWGKNADGGLGVGTPSASNQVDQIVPRRIVLPGAPSAARVWLLRLSDSISSLSFFTDRACSILAPPMGTLEPSEDLQGTVPQDSVLSILFPSAVELRCIAFTPAYVPIVERWDGQFFTVVPFELSAADNKLRMPVNCTQAEDLTSECLYGTCTDGFCHCIPGYQGLLCDAVRNPIPLATEGDATDQVACGERWCLPDHYCSKYQECAQNGSCGGYTCGLHGRCVQDDCICEEGWVGITCERELASESPNSCLCLPDWQDPFGLGRCAGTGNKGCCSPDRDPLSWCMDQCGHWRYCSVEFWCEQGARLEQDWSKCSRVPTCFGHENFLCCPSDPETQGPREPCCPEQRCEANPQCVNEGYATGDCCPIKAGPMLDCCTAMRQTSTTIPGVSHVDVCKDHCLKEEKCEVAEYMASTSTCFISYSPKEQIGWFPGSGGTRWLCEPRNDMCYQNTQFQCGEHGQCVTHHNSTTSLAVCVCTDGWTGMQCEIDPCSEVECGMHGTCDEDLHM